MFTRTCALDGCTNTFQTDLPNKKHCSEKHATLSRVRRKRAKDRNGGGGGNGGGAGPTLFDEIVPNDPQAIYVPDTGYPTLPVPAKHPPERIRKALRRGA